MAHARLSPSNHRWVHCPGSVRVEAEYPDVSGPAAIDGTGSHLLLETCLLTSRHDVRAEEWLHRTIGEGHKDKPEGWYVDRDRVERVQMALDYITRRRQEETVIALDSEIQSNPGHYLGRPDWYGTCDILMRGPNWIEVADYKDGRGYVAVEDNPQLIAYAAGRLAPHLLKPGGMIKPEDGHIEWVRMTVIQPKTNPVIRYHDVPAKVVWDAAKKLVVAANATDDPHAPLVAGKHCTWCKHKSACTAQTDQAMEGLSLMTNINESGNTSLIAAIQTGQISPATMSDEKLAAIMDASALIKKMIEAVEEEAQKRLESGGAIPGYKLGTARSSRKWIDDEDTVAAKLKGMRWKKDDYYPTSLVSPAQALKHDGLSDRQRKALEGMMTMVPGKAKVVKAVSVDAPTIENMFMGCTDTGTVVSATTPPATAPVPADDDSVISFM